jgi:hypothetical protein
MGCNIYKASSVPSFVESTKLRSPLFNGFLVTMNVINVSIYTIAVRIVQTLSLLYAVFFCC